MASKEKRTRKENAIVVMDVVEKEKLVEEANQIDKPSTLIAKELGDFSHQTSFTFQCFRGSEAKTILWRERETLLDWMFQLTKSNMKELYGKEWDDLAKLKELRSIRAYLLFVFEGEFVEFSPSPSSLPLDHSLPLGSPVAFCHFRFDMEEDENVLYLYEIQISPTYRSKGLGSFLIQMMELVANRTKMMKIMLTMQVKNKRAQAFYERCGFVLDPSSPTGREASREGYKIYSKATAFPSSLLSPSELNVLSCEESLPKPKAKKPRK